MPVDSAANLVNALRQGHLLTPSQLEQVSQDLQTQFPTPRALARELLNRDWLTAYQVNQLLLGNAASLLLGPYVMLERLGDNTLGQVFKARHQLMNRLVSLTIVREELLAQEQAVERFYGEIQITSQLSHPNLVHAYDAGPIGRTHFFAMEYVDGIDLEKLVKQCGKLPPMVATAFIRQAAHGLQHAHERGLLHHDLRPANLLVARLGGSNLGSGVSINAKTPAPNSDQLSDATIKVANLGLTLLAPRLRQKGPAAPGAETIPDYISPEQAEGTTSPSIRSNLYSLGCIYYHLLAGNAPFSASSGSGKLLQHQHEEPPALDRIRSDVPGAVLDAIGILMSKRPEDRYESPAELLTALKGVSEVRRKKRSVPLFQMENYQPKNALVGKAFSFVTASPWRMVAIGAALLFVLLMMVVALWPRTGAVVDRGTARGPGANEFRYEKKGTRDDTYNAALHLNGFPSMQGKWYYIGPFSNQDKAGFDQIYPPENEIDLKKTYQGKNQLAVTWKELPNFKVGDVYDLRSLFPGNENWSVVYLYHECECTQSGTMDLGLGSDDTLTFWFNGKKLISNNVYRGAARDQDVTALDLKPGKNQLLLKICQGDGGWGFCVWPHWPDALKVFEPSLNRDFPERKQ